MSEKEWLEVLASMDNPVMSAIGEKLTAELSRAGRRIEELEAALRQEQDHAECLDNAMAINRDWNKEKIRAEAAESEIASLREKLAESEAMISLQVGHIEAANSREAGLRGQLDGKQMVIAQLEKEIAALRSALEKAHLHFAAASRMSEPIFPTTVSELHDLVLALETQALNGLMVTEAALSSPPSRSEAPAPSEKADLTKCADGTCPDNWCPGPHPEAPVYKDVNTPAPKPCEECGGGGYKGQDCECASTPEERRDEGKEERA